MKDFSNLLERYFSDNFFVYRVHIHQVQTLKMLNQPIFYASTTPKMTFPKMLLKKILFQITSTILTLSRNTFAFGQSGTTTRYT